MNLFAELRRRNVIRMAGLYLVVAWLLLQVAETLLPIFDTPGWVLKSMVVLLALGFVPALVFSWIYELTPEGLKRDGEVDAAQSIAPQTAQRMDRLILFGLAAVIAVVAADRLWPEAPVQSQAAVSATEAAVPTPATAQDKTIAVLPFADFSPGGDQAWFADGLAEEILNALARTPDLQVSARTSSFRYKGSELAIPQIAAELGVAHVLEGSVRSTPQRVRVTAQLIRAADGFHLWSQNYDRDLADMIEIQEDLARQIATAMQTSMNPQALAAMAEVGTRSVEAYQAYIRGVAKVSLQEPEEFRAAYALFEEARRLDPGFSSAHARAATFWLFQLNPTFTLARLTDALPEQMARSYDERIDLAIVHATNDIDRLKHRASKAYRELRWREAIELYRAYVAERPGDTDAWEMLILSTSATSEMDLLSSQLDAIWPEAQFRVDMAVLHVSSAYRLPDKAKAADHAQLLAQRWPASQSVLYQAHRALLWDNRVDAARTLLERMRLIAVENAWSLIPPARQACAEGRRTEVEFALTQTHESVVSTRWHLLMLLGRVQEANEALHALERNGNTFALTGFLIYPHFDPTPFPSLMAVLARERIERPPAEPLPFACPPPAESGT
jgi:TolB-like protein